MALVNAGLVTAIIGAFTILQLSVSSKDLGVATATCNAMRSVGGSVATAVYSTILINQVTKNTAQVAGTLILDGVAPTDLPTVLGALALGDLRSPALTSLPADTLTDAIYAQKVAWSGAFRMVYLVSIAFGSIAVICAACSRDASRLISNKVDVQLKGAYVTRKHDDADAKN